MNNENITIVDENEGRNTSIPSTPLEPAIPSQPERPSIPLEPATPIMTPEEEITARKEEIKKLEEMIALQKKRINELIEQNYAEKVKEVILNSNHYYIADKKIYRFESMEQKELKHNLMCLLSADFVLGKELSDILTFFGIPNDYVGYNDVLLVSLEPICL